MAVDNSLDESPPLVKRAFSGHPQNLSIFRLKALMQQS
jgi:hypothetical protein